MFTLGLDFGTNSVRALVVDCRDGSEVGTGVAPYPSGRSGILTSPTDPHLARQHPGDYLRSLRKAVQGALDEAAGDPGFAAGRIVGVGVTATGSSPLPVDARNRALGMLPEWRRNLDAQCWLWKDHTGWREAALITDAARQHLPEALARCGGTYSSEWFWSKVWHCRQVAPKVFAAAHSWVELTDWIPSVLAGIADPADIRRGICCAGHKALYVQELGGLPGKGFLSRLDPSLAALRDRLYTEAFDATTAAGHLCRAWSRKLGLPEGIPIAIGEMDVHYGSIGSGIAEGTLVKVIGTSTCDCAIVPIQKPTPEIPGICGVVPGAILPDAYSIEAGQSAVGDIFNWWVGGVLEDPSLHDRLAGEAARLQPGQSGLLALDWNNGNRCVLVDQQLSGLLLGQTLHTTRAEIYRALIEATAFGARVIIERLRESGVPIRRVVCAGGIAIKSPLLMQIYADVTGCTMRIAGSSQACALGAAISAAVIAGEHRTFSAGIKAMTLLRETEYRPRARHRRTYNRLYALYRVLHDGFGGVHREVDLSDVMKDLFAIRAAVPPHS